MVGAQKAIFGWRQGFRPGRDVALPRPNSGEHKLASWRADPYAGRGESLRRPGVEAARPCSCAARRPPVSKRGAWRPLVYMFSPARAREAPGGPATGKRTRRPWGPRGPRGPWARIGAPGAGSRPAGSAGTATGPACGGEAVGGGSVAQEGRPRRGGPCGDPRGGWGPLDTPDTGGRGAPGATLLPATAYGGAWPMC